MVTNADYCPAVDTAEPATVAIIGAGLAGLSCARLITSSPTFSVTVFDKSRGIGGRLATRRGPHGQWDHGAQYLTAQTKDFLSALEHLPQWTAASGQRQSLPPSAHDRKIFVSEPAQNSFLKSWTKTLDVRLNTSITAIEHTDRGWTLSIQGKPIQQRFDYLLVTTPAPQAQALLKGSAALPRLDQVELAPCWTLMVATAAPLSLPAALYNPHPDVAWVAANHTKPGRDTNKPCYVMQAHASWSEKHIEDDIDSARNALMQLLQIIAGQHINPLHTDAHRWRYAQTQVPLGEPFLYNSATRLGVAGDWCLGERAEHAFQSGCALAKHLINSTKPPLVAH